MERCATRFSASTNPVSLNRACEQIFFIAPQAELYERKNYPDTRFPLFDEHKASTLSSDQEYTTYPLVSVLGICNVLVEAG